MGEDTTVTPEIKGLQDDIASLQDDINKVTDDKIDTLVKTKIDKMATKAGELAEEHQTLVARVDAAEKESKEREESYKNLELLIAKRSEGSGSNDQVSSKEYHQAFNTMLKTKKPIADDISTEEYRKLVMLTNPHIKEDVLDLVVKGLSVGSDSDGGYLCPVDRMREIEKREYEMTPIRQVASVISTASEAVSVVMRDQRVSSGWQCEFDDSIANTGTGAFAEKEISTHIQYSYPDATQKVLDDASIDLESMLVDDISEDFALTEGAGSMTGDGVGKMRGLLTYPAWSDPEVYERGALGSYTTATANVLVLADLQNQQAGLLEAYQSSAKWMGHRLTWSEITKLKDDHNRPLINPDYMFVGSAIQLIGKNFVFSGDMPKPNPTSATPFTTGDKFLLYGNFAKGYLLVDRMGIRIIRDNITKKGYVQWYVTKRVGGDVKNYQAIKVQVAG